MSTQGRNSQQVLDPEHSNSPMKPMSLCETRMSYDTLKHLDLGTTSLSKPGTKTSQGGKPSITPSPNDYDSAASSTSAKSRPLSLLSRPICEDKVRDHATRNLEHTNPAMQEENRARAKLREQLEAHFHGLKREFEVKKGTRWTPLRPWANEGWEWDDGGGGEAEGVVGWC